MKFSACEYGIILTLFLSRKKAEKDTLFLAHTLEDIGASINFSGNLFFFFSFYIGSKDRHAVS